MPGDAGLTPLDYVQGVAAVMAAVAALFVAWVAWREVPALRKSLSRTEQDLHLAEFVANELDDLIQKAAKSPSEGTSSPHNNADHVLLKEVRTGRHDPIYDRIVFEFIGGVPDYEIQPLMPEQLVEFEVQGQWGLLVQMTQCGTKFRAGPSQGQPAISETGASPDFPTIRHHRLVRDHEGVCEWVIGVRQPTRYWTSELEAAPRLVIDLFRSPSE